MCAPVLICQIALFLIMPIEPPVFTPNRAVCVNAPLLVRTLPSKRIWAPGASGDDARVVVVNAESTKSGRFIALPPYHPNVVPPPPAPTNRLASAISPPDQ